MAVWRTLAAATAREPTANRHSMAALLFHAIATSAAPLFHAHSAATGKPSSLLFVLNDGVPAFESTSESTCRAVGSISDHDLIAALSRLDILFIKYGKHSVSGQNDRGWSNGQDHRCHRAGVEPMRAECTDDRTPQPQYYLSSTIRLRQPSQHEPYREHED